MTTSSLLFQLGSLPFFASRPFLAGLITGLLARHGTSLPWIGDNPIVTALSHAPAWFTSTPFLVVLGVLALLEGLASGSPEARAVVEELDPYIKAVVAALTSMAILGPEDLALIDGLESRASLLSLGSLGALLVGGAVYALALVRKAGFEYLDGLDEGDDLGLISLAHWAETSWTVLGLVFLVLFPLAAIALAALTTGGLVLARRRAEAREEAMRVPCASCGERIYATAPRCPSCGTDVASPRAVGVFGQPRKAPAGDLEEHRALLVARKRCPNCATRLREREVRQTCATCGRVTFAGQAEFEVYLASLSRRMPRTLFICAVLSAVPLLGVIPGVIYYRLTIVSGLRGYIPPLTGCSTRVVVRLVNWGLIAFQPIPVLGALVVPAMCASNYWIYRRALVGRAEERLTGAPPAPRPA